jgi:hypothetical protein
MVAHFFAQEVPPKWGMYLKFKYESPSVLTDASAAYRRQVSLGEKEREYRKSGI